MELYYTDKKNIYADYMLITGSEAHHISKVMRHKPDDIIYVTDGLDNEYQTVIKSIEKNSVKAEIFNRTRKARETTAKITLAQSVIKGNHMDDIIEKATELGVSEIQPIITARTIASLSDKKAQRYQKLMLSAMKTSTRTHLPCLSKLTDYQKLLETVDNYELALLAYEEEATNNRLKNILQHDYINKVLLIIGPEGGFNKEEVQKAKTRGVKCFSLGPRRLRAETAAITALSLLLYELKEM
jgi:16S rRNA (uracil1498-N3)-methyltransferase